MIFLCEFDVHDGTSVSTLYVGTHGTRSGPNDMPANQYYSPRLSSVGRIERAMFGNGDGVSGGTTGGASQVGFGNISVLNGTPYGEDELIDHWINYAFRNVTVKSMVSFAQPFSQAVTRFVGTIEQLVSTNALEHFDLIIHDRLKDLDKPLLVNTYDGTTISGGNGTVDGDVDMTDQIKQKIWGTVHNVAAISVNHFDLVWQVSDGPVTSIIVYDGGVALTYQGDVGTLSTLFATNIALGSYITCKALGLFRLGSPAIGAVTADVVEGATAADRTAAQIVQRMIDWFQDNYPDVSVEVTDDDVDNLDDLNSAECGILVTQTESGLTAIMRVLNSIGAWILPQSDSESILNLGRFDSPDDEDDPITSYDFDDNLGGNPERIESGDDSKGVPAWKLIVKYDQIATVQQSGDLFGLVTENDPVRVQYLSQEWRQASIENEGILEVWPNAPTITIETRLLTQAAAQAEAARLFALYSVQRDIWKLTVPMSDDPQDDPGIGEIVELTSRAGRMGLGREIGSGDLFRVLGRVDDFDSVPTLALTLYGPPRVAYVAPVIVPPPPDNSIQAIFGGTSSLRVDSTVVTVASDADVEAWVLAVVGAGGGVTTTRKTWVYDAVTALKTQGIWPIIDRLFICAGGDRQGGRICIKTRIAATEVGPPTFTQDRGYTFNGSTYLNTNFNPVTNGVNYTLNSAHMVVWDNTSRGPVTCVQTGVYDGANVADIHVHSNIGSQHLLRVNDATLAAVASSSSLGMFLAQRTNSTTVEFYYNGTALTGIGGSPSTAMVNLPFYVGGRNDGGSLQEPTTDQISMFGYGGKMTSTQAANYFTIMRTYMTHVGVS